MPAKELMDTHPITLKGTKYYRAHFQNCMFRSIIKHPKVLPFHFKGTLMKLKTVQGVNYAYVKPDHHIEMFRKDGSTYQAMKQIPFFAVDLKILGQKGIHLELHGFFYEMDFETFYPYVYGSKIIG